MMWVMTKYGFVSIVEKPSDKKTGTLTVRARDRRSLEAFAHHAGHPEFKASVKIETDYPYRAVFERNEVINAMISLVDDIDYTNFKNAAKAQSGNVYANALSRVWGTMHALTPKSVQAKVDKKLKDDWQSIDRWLGRRAEKS